MRGDCVHLVDEENAGSLRGRLVKEFSDPKFRFARDPGHKFRPNHLDQRHFQLLE
jgi:hypothetical protein